MDILIAEDDPIARRVLEATLQRWGYGVTVTGDGGEAWRVLERAGAPRLAILDWMMPELEGVEVCRRVRARGEPAPPYLILLTAKGCREDIVQGLMAGADDYLTKPFDPDELRARVHVGRRVLDLQRNLADRVRELETALANVKQLQGLLPICAYCKKIRDDTNYWQQVEDYIALHSGAKFSHGVCPACWEIEVKPQLDDLAQSAAAAGTGPGRTT